ncbi:PREDICTED: signal recognition particle subunit SRP68-like [Branchiostoma belcheri]|uniref:Signal recognition particle subunit SRP68 n=1 Tax=Branchiostoma belcheri TaxID=7741 RepID=A0A6P4XTE8_BRABE|nr:PREDICTED: signal recognition particle subunit SRP68-like [Branchiostoma belcheri]
MAERNQSTGDQNADVLPQEETEEEQNKVVLTLEILQTIKDAQQTHGLRHGDYQRYRGYCARRLRRLRKGLHFTCGNRHKFQRKPITEELLSEQRFLLIPLMEAERAWSYAMQLKQEANTEHRKQFHMVSRMKKAAGHAATLAKLCDSDKVDARTKLEAQAYSAWMQGSLEFEVQLWEMALNHFNEAKTIYEKLSSALPEDARMVYDLRVEDIKPSIRYCAYNIGDQSAMEDLLQMRVKSGAQGMLGDKLDELVAQTREKQAATISEVTWQGRTVSVKQEQVRLFLLSYQESSTDLQAAPDTNSKLEVYEKLLMDCKDAMQVLRAELREDPSARAAQAEGKTTQVGHLLTYLTYIRNTITIQRNLLMADTVKASLSPGGTVDGRRAAKPQDLVRLYDIILQNVEELRQLPGVQDDTTTSQNLEAQSDACKAYRSFYIAKSYAVSQKWKEAVALYDQALVQGKTALGLYASLPDSADRIAELEGLVAEVHANKSSSHASCILDSPTSPDEQDLTLNDTGANMVTFPPNFQPIPCKPLFFDLALNHVEFPSLQDRLAEQKKGGGIANMVKGWFWGGGNK